MHAKAVYTVKADLGAAPRAYAPHHHSMGCTSRDCPPRLCIPCTVHPATTTGMSLATTGINVLAAILVAVQKFFLLAEKVRGAAAAAGVPRGAALHMVLCAGMRAGAERASMQFNLVCNESSAALASLLPLLLHPTHPALNCTSARPFECTFSHVLHDIALPTRAGSAARRHQACVLPGSVRH